MSNTKYYIGVLIIFVLFLFLIQDKAYNQGYIQGMSHLKKMHNHYDKLSQHTPCGNISKYVTGVFTADVYSIKKDAWKCKNNVTDQDLLYNIDWLDNCSEVHIDCEDVSFMIDCLAKEYNISCEYYTYLAVNNPHHRGIYCNVSGESIELY